MQEIGVVIMAAGQGTRMRSSLPKVLHSICGKPLILHVLATARALNPDRMALVIGHGAEQVREAAGADDVACVVQEQQLGTGHAVLSAANAFGDFFGDVVIMSGDVPLIRARTLQAMIEHHRRHQAALTLLTASLDRPQGYGRIVRDGRGRLTRIVEEKDATDEQRKIPEVNAGIYVGSARFVFSALSQVKNHNQQGEYYLPDIVAVGRDRNEVIETVPVDDCREMLGVNTREELAFMEKTLRESINRRWMLAGVTLTDPETTYIEEGVSIGRDTVIGPNTHLKGKTVVGERCRIDGSAFVTDAVLDAQVHLRFSVVMSNCRVGAGAIIGPFAHLRPGTDLGANVHIGNFVETKEATLGEGTKANHLTYLGDVTIGRDTNIGAGTITCNYDGFHKYKTVIGNRVQVGSDTTLVAPIALGDDVYVATASTVRNDVPAGALVFNPRDQQVREGWTEQKRRKMKGSQ